MTLQKLLRFSLCLSLILVTFTLCFPEYLIARTPTWDGWDFDVVKVLQKDKKLRVYVRNSSKVAENVGKVRLNVLIDGREVDSRYLDIRKGDVSSAQFLLPDVTGVHSVACQIWGGAYYGWKFDETPSKRISFGRELAPPARPFEITSRDSGPYTIYKAKFSPSEVNKMADSWYAADDYSRKIAWKIVNEKFNMSKEIMLALATTIKLTADNLHNQSRLNRNRVLVYELNFDNRAVPVIQSMQVVSAAVDIMKAMFDTSRFIWQPISMK